MLYSILCYHSEKRSAAGRRSNRSRARLAAMTIAKCVRVTPRRLAECLRDYQGMPLYCVH